MEPARKHTDLRTRESYVEQLIRNAIEAGKFDNLEGAGKPIPDLDEPYDENWWVRKLMKRDQLQDFWKS
ncbi:MAG TPA: DUF1992 domain-containing protein [Planctomycetota bacterium]|nr:DUF1992 domain-containing protein [Planctomycetota bacterium]